MPARFTGIDARSFAFKFIQGEDTRDYWKICQAGQEVQNTKDFQSFCKAGLEMPKAMLGGVGRHKESSDARLGEPKRHSCEKAYGR